MESFRKTHPNYSTYESEHFYVTEVSEPVRSGLHGLLASRVFRNCSEEGLQPCPNLSLWLFSVRSHLERSYEPSETDPSGN